MNIGRTIRRLLLIVVVTLAVLSSSVFAPASQANVEQRTALYAGTHLRLAVPTTYSAAIQLDQSPKTPAAMNGTFRPLDIDVSVTGTLTQGTWVSYTHDLGPNPDSLHPVKAYDSVYSQMWGVGKYATDFGTGTASADMFGNGIDGDQTIVGTQYTDDTRVPLSGDVSASQKVIGVANITGFTAGQEVMIVQMQGATAGTYEFGLIESVSANAITLDGALLNAYFQSGNARAQVLRVYRYHNVTVPSGAMLAMHPWDGSTGGVLVFRVSGILSVQNGGSIYASGFGYRAPGTNYNDGTGIQGEGITGIGGQNRFANANGGGGGESPGYGNDAGGGGGGYASNGSDGKNGQFHGGQGGLAVGVADLSSILMGGAGGSGGDKPDTGLYGGGGGSGAGIVAIYATNIQVDGSIVANGYNGGTGGCNTGGGGAGAGGSILLKASQATLGNGLVTSYGGAGGTASCDNAMGGNGSQGRIRIEYCENLIGTTNPNASTQKLSCYIIAQVESAPYYQGQLNLPENVNGSRTYKVQYGRKIDFAGAGNQLAYLRVPAGLFGSVSLDSLVNGLSSNALLLLDVGDDGSIDWNTTVANDSTNTNGGLASAFNAYWLSHGAPVTGTLDVPVRVWLGGAGQLLLTNLIMSPKFAYLPLVAASTPQLAAPILNAITPPVSDAHYTVSWSSVPNATAYLLQEATDSSFAGATTAYSGTNLSAQLPSRNITTYYYRVMASNQNNNSTWSNSQSVNVNWELEPDNFYTQSTQILSSGQNVYGYPNDAKDFFIFYAPVNGQITVDLTNHTGQGVQLQLFYQSVSNRVGLVTGSPYHLSYSGLAGWYYVYIYSAGNYNSNSPYTLNVSYPASLAQAGVTSP